MAYRVIITGCRHWDCPAVAHEVIRRLEARVGAFVIVHGGARGVDHAFEQAARMSHVATEPHPADWDAHGKGAGPLRNAAMVDAGADLCIAVHRDLAGSKGTKDCVRRALTAGIPVWHIDSEDVTPKPIRDI